MKLKMRSLFLALSFLIVAGGGGILVKSLKGSQAQDTKVRTSKTMVEIISNQIETGNTLCPNDDLLTYETCLLFQGALGLWQRVGLSETCPNIKDYTLSRKISEPKTSSRKISEPKTSIKISRKDVERSIHTPCFGYLYSINVANTVPILISTPNRIFQMEVAPNFSNPGSDPELCLRVRHGLCGNHAAVAIGFFERAGFKVRAVEFYYEYEERRQSHITPEVLIDNQWRLIDTTYGAYWVDPKPGAPFELMPTNSLLAGSPSKIFYNTALLPYAFYLVTRNKYYNYFSYLIENADIIRGGVGKISIDIKDKVGIENFKHKPNYVGDNESDGLTEGIQFKINAVRNKYSLTVNVLSAAFSDTTSTSICIDDSCEKYSNDKKAYRFVVKNPSILYLKSTADVSYVVMKSLEWEAMNE